jgi:hypothetical protein
MVCGTATTMGSSDSAKRSKAACVYNVYNLISAYVYERLRTCLGSLDGPENDYYY